MSFLPLQVVNLLSVVVGPCQVLVTTPCTVYHVRRVCHFLVFFHHGKIVSTENDNS